MDGRTHHPLSRTPSTSTTASFGSPSGNEKAARERSNARPSPRAYEMAPWRMSRAENTHQWCSTMWHGALSCAAAHRSSAGTGREKVQAWSISSCLDESFLQAPEPPEHVRSVLCSGEKKAHNAHRSFHGIAQGNTHRNAQMTRRPLGACLSSRRAPALRIMRLEIDLPDLSQERPPKHIEHLRWELGGWNPLPAWRTVS